MSADLIKKQVFLTALILLMHTLLWAHESRPLYIKITADTQKTDFEINLPNTVSDKNLPLIFLNKKGINEREQWLKHTSGFRQKWSTPKADLSLKGSTIRVNYPVFNPVLSTIIALQFKDGSEQILVIPPNKTTVFIPEAVNALEVRKQYSLLGVEHIWAGIDHLLFLVCLLIITGFSRKLFYTISGFTIAHSITLILSALKVIQLPIPPIEATIALSIVFLCYEIIHHHEHKNSLTYRYPILVASSFGLLHGLGFAAVLGEIGLPQNHTVEALLFFNVGVEIGQLIFIAGLFIGVFFIGKLGRQLIDDTLRKRILSIGLKVAVYIVGITSAYWMFERIL